MDWLSAGWYSNSKKKKKAHKVLSYTILKSTNFSKRFLYFSVCVCVWEQLLGAVWAQPGNTGQPAAVVAFSSWLSLGQIAGRSWNITSTLENKRLCLIAALSLQECVRCQFISDGQPLPSAGILCCWRYLLKKYYKGFTPPIDNLSLCWSLVHLSALFYLSEIRLTLNEVTSLL